ncbi:MAG: metal-dependent hydrolase [Betaproteobacteria bacterium]|nr:metal-dependent hydrolase [Betaproteobacteria bacterium]MBI2959216.1 metal-dependent hydrolase [Betaproteobacteria bacterium]
MDTITHALSGALIARATARAAQATPLPRRLLLGTAAAAFPDADFVLSAGAPIAYLLNHRGITHSLVLLPAWAWLLAWLAALLWRDPRGWRPYIGVCAMGVGIHIAGDVITSYGTMILAPLSDARFSLGTTFIIDLYFSGIILAGLAASGVWRASRAPAIAAMAVLAAYVGLQAVLKNAAIEAGEGYARAQGLAGANVSALERPLSPFNWRIIVARGDEQRYADVSLIAKTMPPAPADDAGLIARLAAAFAPPSMARWTAAPRFGASAEEQRIAREAWRQPAFAFYRWFADYPALYRIERDNPRICVWFEDLRFTTPGRRDTPFRYGLCREGSGPWQPHRLLADGGRAPLY